VPRVPGEIFPAIDTTVAAGTRRVGPVDLTRYERPGKDGAVSQDATMVTRIAGPRGDDIPGITRYVVIDGVTDVDAPEMGFVTPKIVTANDVVVPGPIVANRTILKHLRLNVRPDIAVSRAHQELLQRWGPGYFRRDGNPLKPREMPQSAVGVTEVYDYPDGRMTAKAWRWADTENWELRNGLWSRTFPEHIWTKEMRDRLTDRKADLKRLVESGYVTEEEAVYVRKHFDRAMKDPREVWETSEAVGRYPGEARFEYAEIEDGWDALLLCTDGPRFKEWNIAQWRSFMDTGPEPDPNEEKDIDDIAILAITKPGVDRVIEADRAVRTL
jgi:hypothetical protein